MRQTFSIALVLVSLLTPTALTTAQPLFINGMVIDGGTRETTGAPGANDGRFGFFSDFLPYETRVQRIDLNVHPVTGRISQFRIKDPGWHAAAMCSSSNVQSDIYVDFAGNFIKCPLDGRDPECSTRIVLWRGISKGMLRRTNESRRACCSRRHDLY